MESDYFETSWKVKIQRLRRHARNFFRLTVKHSKKRKGYTRFLTDEEERWLAEAKLEISTKIAFPYGPT